MFICPNCGARVTGWRCEYCETVFPERKAEEDKLNKLIREYSREIDEATRQMAQANLELEALYADIFKTSDGIDDVVKWTFTFLVIIVVAAILPLFLS